MQPSFIFGGNTGMTYEQMMQARALADQFAMSQQAPQNVGEGWTALGRAFAERRLRGQANQAEQQGKSQANDLWSSLWGRYYGGGPSASTSGGAVMTPGQQVGADTMAALGKGQNYRPGDRESFISAMMPHAIRVSQETGLDPRLVIAQAAQETGWGRSAPNNNFFGIKSHGKSGGANLGTFEYSGGQKTNVTDSFRTYGGMGESASDYSKFLRENPRYREMLAAPDLAGQVAALGASGYATDPNYASSVGAIANSISMPPNGQGGSENIPLDVLANAAANPYMSEGQRSVLGSLLQQRMQQQQNASDPAYQMQMQQAQLGLQKSQLELEQMQRPAPLDLKTFTGPDGAVYSFNPATGQAQPLTGAEQPPRPMTADERAQWGIPQNDMTPYYLKDGAPQPIGKAGVTVNNQMGGNKFDEVFATEDAKALGAVSTAGIEAQSNIGRIARLGELMANSPSGSEAAFKSTLGDYGIATEGLDNLQAAEALINAMVPGQRPPGSGTMSDRDVELFKKSLPRLINTPEGNAQILSTLRGIAEYDMQRGAIVQALRSGQIDRAQAFEALQRIPNPLSGFSAPAAPQPSSDADLFEKYGITR